MELDEANELVIREALRRLGPKARLDPALLQDQIGEVLKQQGEAIFAQLSEAARQQLRREGLRINEQTVRLERINEAIRYGHSLVAKYKVETLGELPPEEQMEFARLSGYCHGRLELPRELGKALCDPDPVQSLKSHIPISGAGSTGRCNTL